MKQLFAAGVLMLASQLALAAGFTPGFEYQSIDPQPTANPERIEVIEFFWYGCPHCFHFEPDLNRWIADKPANVDFIRVPAPLNPSWELHTKAFYALELMGKQNELHEKLFDAIHLKKMRLFDESSLADFMAANGVDREDFIKKMNSFTVTGKLNKAKKMMKDYQLKGVPQLAINGKYITSGRMAGGMPEMIKVLDFLIAKESKK
jgi:thiol:disulfide interchange protein DsbA